MKRDWNCKPFQVVDKEESQRWTMFAFLWTFGSTSSKFVKQQLFLITLIWIMPCHANIVLNSIASTSLWISSTLKILMNCFGHVKGLYVLKVTFLGGTSSLGIQGFFFFLFWKQICISGKTVEWKLLSMALTCPWSKLVACLNQLVARVSGSKW